MENTTMERCGVLALECLMLRLPTRVLKSTAGYYIGTSSDDHGPVSRESVEYFRTHEAAARALASGNWTQRMNP